MGQVEFIRTILVMYAMETKKNVGDTGIAIRAIIAPVCTSVIDLTLPFLSARTGVIRYATAQRY